MEPPTAAPRSTVLLDVSPLNAVLSRFSDERAWEQFHSPKNLVLALTGEVNELAVIFQRLSDNASLAVASNPATAYAVREELADILLYLVRLASVLGVDLNAAVTQKILRNADKYPGVHEDCPSVPFAIR